MHVQNIDEYALEALALGAAVLGSGGGGNPRYAYLMARQAIQEFGPVKLLSLDELNADDFVVPLGFMGAPLVCMEKIPSGLELRMLLKKTEELYDRKVTALITDEIGGGNAFTPFLIAGVLGLPVVDADMLGRAFPELQMSSIYLMEDASQLGPTILSDDFGNLVSIESSSPKKIEELARAITVSMGSTAALMMHAMTGDKARNAFIAGSVSRSLSIGKTLLQARQEKKENPVDVLVQKHEGKVLMRGMITDIDHAVHGGFLRGSVRVEGDHKGEFLYQNEYLLARVNGEICATTPDILCLMEDESGEPLTTDMLKHGLRVAMVVFPAPPLWLTEKGLAIVGPRAFAFETDYYSWRPS